MQTEVQTFLEDHWRLLSALYSAIEDGISESQTFFERRAKPRDPWLEAHIVRRRICWNLQELADTDLEFEQIDLPMSGVEVRYKNNTIIKVLKADDGEMPAAGQSARRRDFYNRNLFGSDLEVFNLPSWALLWDREGEVKLVFPKDAEQPWKTGSERMSITLPHPAQVEWHEPVSGDDARDRDLPELTVDLHNLDIAAVEEQN